VAKTFQEPPQPSAIEKVKKNEALTHPKLAKNEEAKAVKESRAGQDHRGRYSSSGHVHEPPAVVKGSILQNSISAEINLDKFLSLKFGHISTQNKITLFILVLWTKVLDLKDYTANTALFSNLKLAK
jgi:hypothetical protein